MRIHQDITELIGNTPLLLLKSFSEHARLVGKLEYLNPSGSSKDRVANAVLQQARKNGLKEGDLVLEKCGGNTAVGLSWLAACSRYRLELVVPDQIGDLPIQLCEYLGARVVDVPGREVTTRWQELAAAQPEAHRPDQFSSEANVDAHRTTTGPEIWRDTDGEVDAVIAGIGTGGTLAGIARFIKPRKPRCDVVGVEPSESPVFSGRTDGPHDISGIGLPTRPVLLEDGEVDEVMLVSSDEAARMTRELACREGVLAGMSSGAVLHAAVEYAARPLNRNKLVVAMLCDGLGRYMTARERSSGGIRASGAITREVSLRDRQPHG
jgi:cysteine synthase A